MKKNYFGFIITGLLTLLFVILKLCNIISWSLIWILSPLWIVLGINILIILVFFFYTVIKVLRQNIKYHKENTGKVIPKKQKQKKEKQENGKKQ